MVCGVWGVWCGVCGVGCVGCGIVWLLDTHEIDAARTRTVRGVWGVGGVVWGVWCGVCGVWHRLAAGHARDRRGQD